MSTEPSYEHGSLVQKHLVPGLGYCSCKDCLTKPTNYNGGMHMKDSIINAAATVGVVVWALVIGGFIVAGLHAITGQLLGGFRE